MKINLLDFIVGTLVGLAFLVVVSWLDDGPTQEQLAAEALENAQQIEKQEALIAAQELRAREAYAAHLLALDHIK